MTSHRVTLNGEETLEDLLRPGLRAVIVGINPSRVSVTAGHYYQGRLGKLLWKRLRSIDVLPPGGDGREDDVLFTLGIGFTDIVKRPTARAHELSAADFAAGRAELESKLAEHRPELVIYTYKRAAVELCGPFRGNGRRPEATIAGIPGFVMPGPYESATTASATLAELKAQLSELA